MSDTTTSFENKCNILGDFWVEFKDSERFEDFIQYNDLGLPIAFAIATGLVKSTPLAETYVTETFDLLLGGLGIEDTGFEDIEEILGFSQDE